MKKSLKKLTLSRETLRSLDDRYLQEAGGGGSLAASCITAETRRCSVCPTGCTDC